jgi:hypothetical protein
MGDHGDPEENLYEHGNGDTLGGRGMGSGRVLPDLHLASLIS